MVNYQGVLSIRHVASGGNVIPIMHIMCPVCQSFVHIPVCCIHIIVHDLLISSLFIGMHTLLLGLNNARGHPKYKSGIAAI